MRSITTTKTLVLVALAILAVTLNVSVAFAQVSGDDVGGMIAAMLSSPPLLITFVIELALGLGLGYFSAKAFKYILGLIGIFVIGVVLNIWASPQIETNLAWSKIGVTFQKVYPVVMSIVYMLGLTTVLPITVGFIIGLAIAIMK